MKKNCALSFIEVKYSPPWNTSVWPSLPSLLRANGIFISWHLDVEIKDISCARGASLNALMASEAFDQSACKPFKSKVDSFTSVFQRLRSLNGLFVRTGSFAVSWILVALCSVFIIFMLYIYTCTVYSLDCTYVPWKLYLHYFSCPLKFIWQCQMWKWWFFSNIVSPQDATDATRLGNLLVLSGFVTLCRIQYGLNKKLYWVLMSLRRVASRLSRLQKHIGG